MLGVTTAVRIEVGGRPEQATHVTMTEWEGPLGLLLSLIESKRLDVLNVPLGALAGAYLDALASIEGDRIGSISAFVAVAGQLILIKSRAMLPRQAPSNGAIDSGDEGPDPERELRARLLLYRAYRDAGLVLQAVAEGRGGLFRREPGVAASAGLAGARAPEGPALDPAILAASLAGLAVILPEPEAPAEVVRRAITITERARVLRDALRGAPAIVLQDLLHGVTDRVVVAVTFLAMLELMKRREIVVEQAEPFGPITARRTRPEERHGSSAAARGDEAPFDETLESFG